ncbi:hypothetical protein LSAT2_005655 [Lamellibrachia satsuma]|nr:hypothetical protein LSAT2_005655 [Lamellibrachia satsuma]
MVRSTPDPAIEEPDIAARLIFGGHLSREGCVDYTSKHIFYTWKLQIDDAFHFSRERSKYYMQYVAETNVFVGVKSAGSVEGTCRSCFKRSLVASTSPIRCQSEDDDICQCPCHGALEFHYCRNTFPHREDALPVCSPVGQEANFSSPMPNESEVAATLPRCYTSVCSNITDKGDCLAAVGCVWYHVLSRDAECLDMEEAKTRTTPSVEATHSTADRDTPVADVTRVSTFASVSPVANDVPPPESHTNVAVIIVPVVGFVVIVGIIAVVVMKSRQTPVTESIYQGMAASTTSSISGMEMPNLAYDPDPSSSPVAVHAANPGTRFNPDVVSSTSTGRP